MTNWLDDLDDLPTLDVKVRTKSKSKRVSKPKRATPTFATRYNPPGEARIPGEARRFNPATPKDITPRGPDIQRRVREYEGRFVPTHLICWMEGELNKAAYRPSHFLGISPFIPTLHLNHSLAAELDHPVQIG